VSCRRRRYLIVIVILPRYPEISPFGLLTVWTLTYANPASIPDNNVANATAVVLPLTKAAFKLALADVATTVNVDTPVTGSGAENVAMSNTYNTTHTYNVIALVYLVCLSVCLSVTVSE
jgi:hypothetical protein